MRGMVKQKLPCSLADFLPLPYIKSKQNLSVSYRPSFNSFSFYPTERL